MKLEPLLRTLKIRNKDALIVPFRLNWAQKRYLDAIENQAREGKPMRAIILKARQLGISTVTEAVMFSLALVWPNLSGLVVAHENDASEHLLSMTKLFWETFPFKDAFSEKYLSRKHMAWDNGSQMKIATAKNVTSGRSQTINVCHLSEFAFYDRASEVMLGMRQTIPTSPRSFIAIESTANGIGNLFYETWQHAEVGDVEYVPLFFPWMEHPEYKASHIQVSGSLSGRLDEEERVLKKMGTTDDSLAWRRWAIKNLCGNDLVKFHQEYPSTPSEAFISSGTNIFPIRDLHDCYDPMEGAVGRIMRSGDRFEFVEDASGPLTVYRWPSSDPEWGQYFVGGDPTHTTGGDFAVAQVINRRTLEQVAVLRQRCDPSTFGLRLMELGRYFNNAWISTESTGPGYATIGYLVGQSYPKIWAHRPADKVGNAPAKPTYGWATSTRTKEWAIGHLLKLVVDHDFVMHDEITFREMRDYVKLEGVGYGPAESSDYDDTVMALAITHICNHSESPVAPFGRGDPPEQMIVNGEKVTAGYPTERSEGQEWS